LTIQMIELFQKCSNFFHQPTACFRSSIKMLSYLLKHSSVWCPVIAIITLSGTPFLRILGTKQCRKSWIAALLQAIIKAERTSLSRETLYVNTYSLFLGRCFKTLSRFPLMGTIRLLPVLVLSPFNLITT